MPGSCVGIGCDAEDYLHRRFILCDTCIQQPVPVFVNTILLFLVITNMMEIIVILSVVYKMDPKV